MSFTYNYYNKPSVKQKPFVSSNKSYKTTSITDFFSVNNDKDNENENPKKINTIDNYFNKQQQQQQQNNDNQPQPQQIPQPPKQSPKQSPKQQQNNNSNNNHNSEYKNENIKISPLGKKLKKLNYSMEDNTDNSKNNSSSSHNNSVENVSDSIKEENLYIDYNEIETEINNNINSSSNNNSNSNNSNIKNEDNTKQNTSPKQSQQTHTSPPIQPQQPSIPIRRSLPIPSFLNNSNNTQIPPPKIHGFMPSSQILQQQQKQQQQQSTNIQVTEEKNSSQTISSSSSTKATAATTTSTTTTATATTSTTSISSTTSNIQKPIIQTKQETVNNTVNNNTTTTTNNNNNTIKPLAFTKANLTMSTPTLSLQLNKFSASSLNKSSSSSIFNNNNNNSKSSIIPKVLIGGQQSQSQQQQQNNSTLINKGNITITTNSTSLPNFGLINNNNKNNNNKISPMDILGRSTSVTSTTTIKGIPFSEIKISESLSDEQLEILKMICVNGESLFFTGSAGTGKSFLLKEIVRVLRLMYPSTVYLTASTGIAACNIGGTTINSFAGIGLGDKSVREHSNSIQNNKQSLQRWRECKILIIDEVSMVSGILLDKLEEIARIVRRSKEPFGGIQLILCGDFCQLPPVNNAGKFCFKANCWDYVIGKSVQLHKVFRQKDQEFVEILNELRIGIINDRSIQVLNQCFGRQLSIDDGIVPTILYPHKERVNQENESKLSLLPGEPMIYDAIDTHQPNGADSLKNCPAPSRLTLKIGCQVILIKNLDVENELVNGSRGVVVDWTDYTKQEEPLPIVKFLNGVTRVIGRELWRNEFGEIVISSRRQIPLNLAWALSIHKGQGMTIDKLVINLDGVFENGQAYVALSRSSGLQGLQLISKFKKEHLKVDPDVITFYSHLEKINK